MLHSIKDIKDMKFTMVCSYTSKMLSYFSFLFLFVPLTLGAVYPRSEDLPQVEYDFIIVGGGTAGSILANRLTENPSFHVLVIEAGPNNEDVLNSIVPDFALNLQNTVFDWNFTTTPQKGLNGRTLTLQRGRMLGGSSSVNGMVYTRGSSSDYDRFARITGESSWSWNALQPYIRKHEGFVPPVDGRNPVGEFDPRFHGFTGPIHTTLPALLTAATDQRMLTAANQLKGEFAFNLDLNSGTPLGTAWHQSTTGHGVRNSAATGYLPSTVRARPNLHILIETRVTRILQTTGNRKLTLRTVEFTTGSSTKSPRKALTASKEVILSAGSIGTPHILLHSGIGDKNELQKVGIPSVLDLPSVGKNLTEHPIFAVGVNLNITGDTDPWANISTDATLQAEALQIWNANKTGPLASLGRLNQFSFGRIAPSKLNNIDTSSGPNSAHYELAFTGSASSLISAVAVSSPASRGTVTLGTNNPFDQPLIDLRLLTAPVDVILAREAIRAFFKFTTAPVWKEVLIGPTPGFVNNTVDSVLDEFARNTTIANLHPIGTAAMSPVNASWGVVNPDLLVKKASGLRIIDASIYPFIPCGHTQASVYIIAERAADVVKEAWGV